MTDKPVNQEQISANRGPFTVLSSREVYASPWIRVTEDEVIRPGGSTGKFGIVTMRKGSSVLPIDDAGMIFMAREYKYAIRRDSLEAFSGGLEDGESPVDAAKRELQEELGMEASEWVDMGCVDPFTTVIDSPNYMFLAKGLQASRRALDEGEVVRIIKLPFDEALKMALNGEITHSASVILILRAARILGK